MKKIATMSISTIVALFLLAAPAFAHVVVKPNQVGVAAFQTFSVGVPNEKDTPTVALKLLIPDGLNSVMPNVKPGWKIEVKKQGSGDDAKVTEIDWAEGSIPVGQRDNFFFSAQVPSDETVLNWKAYQTYSDGNVVAWNKDPSTIKQGEEGTPYSQTKIVNDLVSQSGQTGNANLATAMTLATRANDRGKIAIGLSVIALVLTAVSLWTSARKKR